ncbi:hypothetical protein KO500_14855 [Cellulophaga baltica]|uniref:hypothetical protein n=1 Tax=Cellulophaga TaxID=104264 RepID=UPI001C075159|nr:MULTISPECIES: hypothetical protein [Cellulophaga]MBU2997727.1 hypothetical protein [Cellulophaga baltica]MDO6769122.1 hypothetical protein [Cellulophaga sp. 1_MG-2023]
MSIIKSLDETTSNAAQSGEDYVKKTQKYYELKIFQQISILSSYILKVAIIGSLCILGLIFLAIAGATALGNYFHDRALGHLCTGLIFFATIILIYLFRKYIDKFIIKKLSKTYFD